MKKDMHSDSPKPNQGFPVSVKQEGLECPNSVREVRVVAGASDSEFRTFQDEQKWFENSELVKWFDE